MYTVDVNIERCSSHTKGTIHFNQGLTSKSPDSLSSSIYKLIRYSWRTRRKETIKRCYVTVVVALGARLGLPAFRNDSLEISIRDKQFVFIQQWTDIWLNIMTWCHRNSSRIITTACYVKIKHTENVSICKKRWGKTHVSKGTPRIEQSATYARASFH